MTSISSTGSSPRSWCSRARAAATAGRGRSYPGTTATRLDCRDYANAGLKIINPDMDAIELRLQGLEEKTKAPQQRRQRQRHNRADAFDDW